MYGLAVKMPAYYIGTLWFKSQLQYQLSFLAVHRRKEVMVHMVEYPPPTEDQAETLALGFGFRISPGLGN